MFFAASMLGHIATVVAHRSAPAQCLQCQALLMKMGRWVSAPRQRGQYWNLGALGMMISCGAGCVETAMTPLGAGPTPGPEVGSPISRCAISPDERFLEGGYKNRPHPLISTATLFLFEVLLKKDNNNNNNNIYYLCLYKKGVYCTPIHLFFLPVVIEGSL